MVNAFVAVMGAALLAWVISAIMEKTGSALTLGQALTLTFVRSALGVRYRGFREASDLIGPVVYLVARQSRLDRWLLSAFLPVGTFHLRLDGESQAVATLVRSVLAGHGRVCIYAPPQVEPSEDALARLTELGDIARHAAARIVPIHVAGARYSLLSFWTRAQAPRKLYPSLTVVAAPPFGLGDTADVGLADHLLDGLAQAKLRSTRFNQTLFQAMSAAARLYGPGRDILSDAMGGKLSYRQMLIGARALAGRFARMAEPSQPVGVLLPNANGAVLTVLGLASIGAPPAMLNYTAGPAAVASAARTAKLKTVIASRAFIDKADLAPVVERLKAEGVAIVYLEDLREDLTWRDKALAFLLWRWPMRQTQANQAAVILFTSGSEGEPKGVVLSSLNLIANAAQADCRVDISPEDKLFNVLPLFHAFGFLGGMVLPLLYGVKLFLYPSPLHYKIVPGVARKVAPTIMFGTDTFLMGYGRAAKDGDFDSLRMIVAGAEAVRPETRKLFAERFGARIVEGYGMTEASPVVAVNSAVFARDGSVGRLLPGMEIQLEPVEGMEEGMRLSVAGPNVMKGYLLPEAPGVLTPLPNKWHDTGDIVTIDERGFIFIRGRVKRFAKIAGEMVSLGAIEMLAHKLWPEADHAAIAMPDNRRGERIVLLTTQRPANRQELLEYAKIHGARDLATPDEIRAVTEIPHLGSGKTDYPRLMRMAAET